MVMTPEIKAAIRKEAENYQNNNWCLLDYAGWQGDPEQTYIDAAEYGYKLAEEKLDLAIRALKYIANSTPIPEQNFEIENKLAAQNALKELGEQ